MYEIFIRCYCLGGYWINLGLTQYVKMDHKSDAGFNMQYNFCGRSMVILKLKLVKGNNADDAAAAANVIVPIGYVNHGKKVFKESV